MDVLVVGAGVAGTTAAIGLAREGLHVMLVDRAKFPRHKVCGCCLNSDAVEILDGLGLYSSLRQLGATPIQQIAIHSSIHSLVIPSKGGVAVSRYTLDGMLHDAAVDAGCRVQDQTTAKILQIPDTPSKLVAVACSGAGAKEAVIHARTVIVADGLAGSCMADIRQAQRATAQHSLRGYGAHLPVCGHDLPRGEVKMYCGRGGYVGTVVLEDGSLDIAAAMKPSYIKSSRGPAGAISALINRSGMKLSGLDSLQWKATAPLTGCRRQLWMRRVFFLGDSAGYVEPFTGEGMAWAMRSAQALQPIVQQAVAGWDDRCGDDWQRAYRHSIQRSQWRCRFYSYALRRPSLVTSLIRLGILLPTPARQKVAGSLLPPMFQAADQPRSSELAAT